MSDTPTTISHYPAARRWLAISVVAAVLGMVASVLWVVWRLAVVDDSADALQRFGVDGPAGLVLAPDDDVDWTIYLEPADRSLSGVRFSIAEADTQKVVALSGARNDVQYAVGGRSGRPVSRVLLAPGTYTVTVSPADEVTLAIGPDLGNDVQIMWLGAVLIGLPTVVGGGLTAGVNGLRVMRGSGPPPSRSDSDSDDGPPMPPS
ncbi:MAG: hypothetical protein AAF081_02945 [Actinomycetota bacterium]